MYASIRGNENKLLEYEVQQKHFRPDLYFRLRSINIHLPAVAQQEGRYSALVEQFVKETSDKNKIHFDGFTDDATELLMNYSWPGKYPRTTKWPSKASLVLESGKRLNGTM